MLLKLDSCRQVTKYGVTPPRARPPLNSRNFFNQSEYSCSRRVLRSTPEVNAGKQRASFRCVLQVNWTANKVCTFTQYSLVFVDTTSGARILRIATLVCRSLVSHVTLRKNVA